MRLSHEVLQPFTFVRHIPEISRERLGARMCRCPSRNLRENWKEIRENGIFTVTDAEEETRLAYSLGPVRGGLVKRKFANVKSGQVQQNPEEVEMLFTLLAERYERRSVVITSNQVFSEWDQIFKNPMTTAAAIDRVVHQTS